MMSATARTLLLVSMVAALSVAAGQVLAQDLIVYPAKQQTQQQMEQDKSACYSWAKKETGFDPMAPPKPTAPPPPAQAPQGGVVRGAARGAVVGGVVGEIANDDAGEGAAAGAAAGALVGGMRRRDQARQQQSAQQSYEQQQAAQIAEMRERYKRAYAACLESKGYTVK